jgi:hypothetical protein
MKMNHCLRVVNLDPDDVREIMDAGGTKEAALELDARLAAEMEEVRASLKAAGFPVDAGPQGAVPASAVNVASLESANTLSQSRAWETGRDLKLALQRAILDIVNGANLLERTPENRAFLIRVGVKDALAALAQNANAIGWYDLKTRQALGVMSLVHPELATDETARFAFTWALATTSNGIKVDKNFELAEMVYSRWKASHKDPTKRVMPTDVKAGKAQKPINKSLQLFNDLSQAWGLTPLRLFMLSNFKAGDIKAMTGVMPTGEWAETDVRGASVIGPKIGNGFFSNLYGKFDALTMDRWLVRTWGRWTGTLIEIDQPNVDKSRARLRASLKDLDHDALIAALREAKVVKKNKKTGVDRVSEAKPLDRENLISAIRTMQFGRGKGMLEAASDASLDALSDAVLRASQSPELRDAMNGARGGEELRLAGNSLAKYLDGQKEQPEGPGERVYIREIFSEMLAQLQQDPRYKDLTMSDLQAVLWYAEKRLYETAKEDIVAADVAALEGDEVAGYDDDDAPDYANAAAKVAREKGVTDRRITAALKKEETRERPGSAQPGAGGSRPEGGVEGGQGQQGQARGFTRSERREFVQRRALDRLRADRGSNAESSGAYARAGGKARGGPGLLKEVAAQLGAAIRDVWVPGIDLKRVFARAEIKTPAVYEIEPGAESAARFTSFITDAKKALGAIGEAVYIYPAEDYAGMRLFLAEGGKAGFALKPDGDIVSVFSAPKTGAGRAIMETAIAAGGRKLDCFHTILPEFYSAHGFRGTSRLLWNDEVAKENMPNWDKQALGEFNGGEPDVVFMVYDPTYRGTYEREATPVFNKDPATDYDRAARAQTKAAKDVASRPAVTTLLQAVTDTPAFKQWFGDSKVVDESGAPLVVYHGTSRPIDTFRSERWPGVGGIYFTDQPAAQEYADMASDDGEGTPTIIPVYLSLKNPKMIEGAGSQVLTTEQIAELKAQGFDGAVGTRDGKPFEYVAFDPTQIKSVNNRGTFDPNNPSILAQEARGFIQFGPAKDKFKITLTGKANLSTFLHESGHFFLEVLQDQVMRGEASPDQVRDFEAIRAWLGLQPGEAIGVKHHEQFARGFEAYLMEGKAPSAELNEPFQKFKAWLIFVYKRLAGLNVNLSDDIRSVMDRLVASDQAISEARVQIGLGGQPMAQDAIGLTDEEYATYVESWMKARDQQSMDADARVLADAARAMSETWKNEYAKVVEELTAEVEKTRGAMARKAIEEGDLKIHKDMVPKDLRGMTRGLTAEAGLDIDTMAEMLNMGFASGEQMLQTIAGSDQSRRDVKARARAIMAERHGEMTPATLAVEAMKAVHNKPTGEILLTEYRALASKAGIKTQKNTMALIKAAAEKKVAGLTKRQLEPAKWRRAELRAANEAGKFAGQGKALEAAIAKRQQLMAAAMYRATVDAQDRIQSIKDYLTTFQTNKRRSLLGKAGEMYLDGIDQILESIEFKNVSLKTLEKRELLPEIIKKLEANDEPVLIPPALLAAGVKNYSQMTLEELEGVHDAVKNLWHLAKLKNTLKRKREKIQLDQAMDQAAATAEANLGKRRQGDHRNPTVIDNAINSLRWVRAQLVKMEFLFGWLDGQPEGGLIHSLMYQPLADARHKEFQMLKEMTRRVLDPIRNMPKEQRVRWATKRQFMGETLTGADIIAVALNLGNEGNKEKLLQGYGWSEARVMAELSAFMTKADWDMVQNIWDSIDTIWPEIERVAKSATGLAPPKVLPSSVQNPFGEYSGGYYPVVYDPVLTQRQAENQEKNANANGLFANNFLRPSMSNGFTKERTKYTAPIKLSLDVLSQHLTETIHFVTHYEAVRQADKIRSHPKFQKLVTETMGREFWGEIRPWLQDIANNVTQRRYPELGEAAMRNLRIGTSIASMGYNLGTGIKQLFGVTTALDAISPQYWWSGIYKSWLSPKVRENWRFAMENSQELEALIQDFDRDIKQVNDYYARKIDGGAVDWFVSHAFSHIGYLQLVVNVSTWHGAYEQAKARGDSHAKRVEHADGVVRKTQSSGAIKDLANVQRSGEATKLVTMFYTFFSIVYNRLEDIQKTTKGVRDLPRMTLRLAVLATLPAMLNIAYDMTYAALTGDDDDEEDPQPLHTRLALESANTLVGSIPVLRSLIDFSGYGGQLSPAFSKFEQIQRAAGALGDLVTEGEPLSRKDVRTIVGAASVITKTPAAAIYNLVDDFIGKDVFDE